MSYRKLTFSSPERMTCYNVRKTRGGRPLILADPSARATLGIDVRPMLHKGDSISTVDLWSEGLEVEIDKNPASLTMRFSGVRYRLHGTGRDYGHANGGAEDIPNVQVAIGLLSGEILTIPMVVRNHNKPVEWLQNNSGARVLTPSAEVQSIFGEAVEVVTTRTEEDLRNAAFSISEGVTLPDNNDPSQAIPGANWVVGNEEALTTPTVEFP